MPRPRRGVAGVAQIRGRGDHGHAHLHQLPLGRFPHKHQHTSANYNKGRKGILGRKTRARRNGGQMSKVVLSVSVDAERRAEIEKLAALSGQRLSHVADQLLAEALQARRAREREGAPGMSCSLAEL